MKQKLIDIFKQAEGKKFTYLVLETSSELSIQTCIENLEIDSIGERSIYLKGKKGEWHEFSNVPLIKIDTIDQKEEDGTFEAEYEIIYQDGTSLTVQIYDEED